MNEINITNQLQMRIYQSKERNDFGEQSDCSYLFAASLPKRAIIPSKPIGYLRNIYIGQNRKKVQAVLTLIMCFKHFGLPNENGIKTLIL